MANLPLAGPGRPPGSKNHATTVRETLADLGFDPIREAVARYRDVTTPSASKDVMLQLVTDRLLPKLRAVEVTGTTTDLKAILINIVAGTQQPAVPIVAEPVAEAVEWAMEDDAVSVDDDPTA